MIEFLTVSSVNADNRKGDIFPSSCGQSVRGAQAHEPWGQFFYSHTLIYIKASTQSMEIFEFWHGYLVILHIKEA